MTNSAGPSVSVITTQNILIITGILIIGFIYMYYFNSSPIKELGGDQIQYNQLAVNMLNGHGFSQCAEPPFTPSIYRTPLYPAFLAAGYTLFGQENYEAIRLIQVLIMLLSSIIVFKITLLITNNTYCAFAALLINVLYGYDYCKIGVYGYLLTETLFILLVNAGVLVLLLVIKYNTIRHAALLGGILAMSMLTRPANLLFPFVIVLFLCVTNFSKRTIITGGVLLSVTFALIAPWTARNYAQFHTFIPLSASLPGMCIFGGSVINNPDFFPYPPNIDYRPNGFAISEERKIRARDALAAFVRNVEPSTKGSGGMEILANDDTLRRIGMEIFNEDKLGFFKRWGYRLLGHWNFGDCANLLNGTKTTLTMVDAIKIICKLGILFIAGFGIFRTIKSIPLWAVLLFPLYNTLLYTPFFSHMRYSMPSRTFIIIVFVIGLFELFRPVPAKPKTGGPNYDSSPPDPIKAQC